MTDKKEKLQKHLLEGFGTLKHLIEVMHQSVDDWYIIDQEKKAKVVEPTGFWFVEQEQTTPDEWVPVSGHRNYTTEKEAEEAVDWYRKNLPNYQYRSRKYIRLETP